MASEPLKIPPPPKQQDEIYFSYWSWHLLKDCPLSYKLAVLEQRRGKRDVGNAIQGSIPDKMSEDWFNQDPMQRDMGFFLDNENFEKYWSKFLDTDEHYVDWLKQARRYAKKDKPETSIPDTLNAEQVQYWEEWAHKRKKLETQKHVENLVKLILLLGIDRKKTRSQVEFKVQIEPKREHDGEVIPALIVGGRIDLVAEDDSGMEDIWDVKAVEDPKKLDIDQLIIYRMGERAKGKIVRNVGFILAKQGIIDPKKITDSHEMELRKHMRAHIHYFRSNNFPANWRSWWCPRFCDVRDACGVNKQRTAGMDLLKLLKPGKVDF